MRILLCVATIVVCLASQSVHAALVITEVASTSGAPDPGPLAARDWWELTNTGPGAVSLDGYSWEDMPIQGDVSVFPNGISVASGESIIIHQGSGVASAFRSDWGLSDSVQVLDQDQFGGGNVFSGLSSGGDQVNFFSTANVGGANVLVSGVAFGASTAGVSFEWNKGGASLGLSVNDENGAHTASNGRVGSPGVAGVPEPTALILAAMALTGVASCGRRRRM